MGDNPKHNRIDEPSRTPYQRVDATPQDPETNTRPRGNGERERGETEKSTRKLEGVLGH